MNFPTWSYPASPFQPTNYYSYPYVSSPYNPPSTSIQTSLNSSSGYESAANEISFQNSPPYKIMPPQHLNVINDDDETDESLTATINEDYQPASKKRRVLSRPQRQEANRRERQRMEIINGAYEDLRNVLPFKKGRKRQKMSRMDTVDGAIRYIQSLLETLHGPNYVHQFKM